MSRFTSNSILEDMARRFFFQTKDKDWIFCPSYYPLATLHFDQGIYVNVSILFSIYIQQHILSESLKFWCCFVCIFWTKLMLTFQTACYIFEIASSWNHYIENKIRKWNMIIFIVSNILMAIRPQHKNWDEIHWGKFSR